MKKIIKALVVLLISFLLISCDTNASFNDILDKAENNIIENINDNQNLIKVIDKYNIYYQSSHPEVISSNGIVTPQEEDVYCTLTIIIDNNGKEYSRTINVKVKGTGIDNSLQKAINDGLREFEDLFNLYDSSNYTAEDYLKLLEIFEEGKKSIARATDKAYVPLIIEEYIMYLEDVETSDNIQDILMEIEEDLYDILILDGQTISKNISLKKYSLYDSLIEWKSSNESIISSTGVVGSNVSKTQVSLSYNVIIDGNTYEGLTINLYVKTFFELSSYYDDIDMSLRGDELKLALRGLITSSHRTIITYGGLRYKLPLTDGDPNNSNNIILLYSRQSISSKWDNGNSWNREHVWPQSLGWFKEDGAGSDIHHIRPTSNSANSSRGNKRYGEVLNRENYKKTLNGNILFGYSNSELFEPLDEIKGDIARILFYLLVRYAEADNYEITVVASSMEMLLKWNEQDPVDDYERQRNQKAYELQGNCNPFIDNSEFAEMIFGQEENEESPEITRYILGYGMTPKEVVLY